MTPSDNYFSDGTRIWYAPTLWKAAESPQNSRLELRPVEDLLPGNFEDWAPLSTFKAAVEFFERVMAADLNYPIILYWEESLARDGPVPEVIICDGYHRLMKAILTKQPLIKAIRLWEMPPPDRVIKFTEA